MTDRLLVFSNPEVQQLLRERFIPVAANDWYQRRRQDAEGDFFRSVADQGPRNGNGTRQGHYVLTAGGKLLGYNNNRGPERRLAMIKGSLEKWDALSPDEKKITVPERGKEDPKFKRSLPKGATVVKDFTRALEKKDGTLSAAIIDGSTPLTAVDHLWIKEDEIKELRAVVASGGELPTRLAQRIARYHLIDNVRGEPRSWQRSEIKSIEITLAPGGKVTGSFHIESSDEKLGYKGEITGVIAFGENEKLQKFNLLILGEHWGEGQHTKEARPGRSPLGQVFQLTSTDKPEDRIPPQGMHWEQGYWEAEEH